MTVKTGTEYILAVSAFVFTTASSIALVILAVAVLKGY